MAVLVDLDRVSARRPDRPLFEDLSLTVSDGDRVGVVGINGTGKSTLLRLIAGVEEPEEGRVRRGRGTTVGWLDQDPTLPAGTVTAAVGEGWEQAAILDRLGMGPLAAADVSTLSGGQAKRVALGRVLVGHSDLLVLDEPTNHLDLPAVAWLERRLATFGGGLVLVSHDRHLLDRLTTRMVELDRGRRYVHEGGYASYLEARAAREERAASAEATRRNLARRELAWLRRGAPARTRKAQARIDSARRIIDGRPQAAARAGELDLSFAGIPRLGDKVVELSAAGFTYPGRPAVLEKVDLALDPAERLGVVGANGTGKSTLLDLIAGRRAPTTGIVETGPTVVVGYYDQVGAELDENARVRDLIAGPSRVPGAPEDNRLMERFWFTPELQFARVGSLSGGERRRLQLLLVLAGRPNVLLLDEPTNDLDLDTLRVLEDFLDDWPGALVTVSHDRTFLDRTTDRIVALDGSGGVSAVAGGLAAWVAAAEAAEPRLAIGRPHTAQAPAGTDREPAASSVPGRRGGRPVGRAGDPDGRRGNVTSGPPRRRSASTLAYQMRELDKQLDRLGRQRDRLNDALMAASDHVDLARFGSELAEVQAALEAAEERWLAL
ncbi:MAG: ABC-F family ATP-binding cassette domain-containing protein, partial [Acidimicrobiaceae bacterium]|nr:ABC-F family ATP-binding cassette domain-containing protein [Acidimicrobiaceae bacterium]